MSHRHASLLYLVLLVTACGGGGGGAGAGGASGGAHAGSGGSPASGSGGTPAGSGGSVSATGGTSGGSGGTPAGSGGAPGTGGTTTAPDAGGGNDTGGPPASGGDVGPRCREMVEAAGAFLKALDAEPAKRAKAALMFANRRHFKYTPGTRPGLALGEMSAPQREAALALVRKGLSQSGFEKTETIRGLELVLRQMEGSNARDPLGYYVAVYGTPAMDGDWAWHYEGHHLSLHYTLSKCVAVSDAPTFFGTNPARVGMNVTGAPPMGTRALGGEEDMARALAMQLSADAQKRAMAIATSGMREVADSPAAAQPVMPAGLAVSAMSPAESESLRNLLAVYADNMPADLAAARLAKIQTAGFDKVRFLWVGGLGEGQAHYYRLQGPTFLVEYLNQQNNANHVHSVWRDFNGDFGEDLLKLHLDGWL